MTELDEIDTWVPVEGFPGYSVNRLGQVRNDFTGHLLRSRFNQYGVPYIGLMREGKQYSRSLPRIVANAFLEEPNAIFDTPIQLDGDRSNCRADNIMWRPRWYAVKYNRQFEERYENPLEVAIEAVGYDEIFPDSFAAACRFGLLEREVVLSILNNTLAWPTYQQFAIIVGD